MSAPDRFAICLPYTLEQECPLPDDWSNQRNFSDDLGDPGGKTMCGITQREYDVYRKRHGEDVQNVRLITRTEGDDIYLNSYWLPYCPNLAPGLDLSFFDASVNEGTHEAIRILQVALAITSDGNWGPITAGTSAHCNVPATIQKFTNRRTTVYRTFRGFDRFGTDWLRRAAQIGKTSLQMANGELT